MLALLALSSALAAPVGVEVAWKGAAAKLHFVAPQGHHVAPDAPIDVVLAEPPFEAHLMGAQASGGVAVADVRGRAITGTADLSVCTDDGSSCQRVSVGFYGAVPDEKKGRVALAAREAAGPPPAAHFDTSAFRSDAQQVADLAFAAAASADELVLLDFTAVWCPPCNAMAVEVLHAPERPAVLDRFVLAAVDADDFSSWALKDRYAVGGYPTLIVAKPDGTEIARKVGYDGPDRLVAWLEQAASGPAPIPAPGDVDPAEAGRIAWELAQAGEGASAYLAVAADGLEARLARVVVDPQLEDARWLVAHAEGRSLDWVPAAMALADVEGGAEVLRQALVQDVTVGSLGARSDRVAYLAELAEGSAAEALWAAAAALLQASHTGDPARDRPSYTSLASFLASAGDVEGAIRVLDGAAAAFPGDPTFSLSAARILLDADRPEQALERADRGLAHAWGDNRLRMATLRVQALVELDRVDEARAFATSVLAEGAAPAAGVVVRTAKYRAALAEAAGVDPIAP